jgi:hypothetical protein
VSDVAIEVESKEKPQKGKVAQQTNKKSIFEAVTQPAIPVTERCSPGRVVFSS